MVKKNNYLEIKVGNRSRGTFKSIYKIRGKRESQNNREKTNRNR